MELSAGLWSTVPLSLIAVHIGIFSFAMGPIVEIMSLLTNDLFLKYGYKK